MEKRKFFVLGIGGTGMRCIESLIHLCAMGMFDNTEIHLLALDTDSNNGNFARLKEVKEAYCKAKGLDEATRSEHADTFFSANIKYYEFSPNYETKSSFEAVFNYSDTQSAHKEEADLADLMFTKNVELFNLRHGYRAQTHLGSMMMYHSIKEAARSERPNDLQRFLQALIIECNSGSARIFILGSVFGGTGASSIPIIPQALNEAAGLISNNSSIIGKAYFGSTLLTSYFNFNPPTEAELLAQKIVASSDRFALNSQVAMMFYDDDTTVKSTYQRFYMLGTEDSSWKPMQQEAETITGGERQRNDSHYIELLSACAALDFLNADEEQLKKNKETNCTDYLYRAVNEDNKLDFQDFVGGGREAELAQKFGMLIAFTLFNNGKTDLMEGLRSGALKIDGFDDIDVRQTEALHRYFDLFFATFAKDGNLYEGWLKQIHRSAGGEDRFLFNAGLFAPTTEKKLDDYDWNNKLYKPTGLGADHKYNTGLFSSKFDTFKKEFAKRVSNGIGNASGISNPAERTYKYIYDTLATIYKFN